MLTSGLLSSLTGRGRQADDGRLAVFPCTVHVTVNVPRRAAALAALFALAACSADLVQLEPGIALRGIVADTVGGHAVLIVTPEAPADIEVYYTSPGEPTYNLRVPARDDSLVIPLARLRPGRTYEYEVRTINTTGNPGPISRGFVTAPATPPELAALNLVAQGSSSSPVVMLEVLTTTYAGFVAVNGFGEPVWSWRVQGNPQGFTVRANGNFVFLDGANGLYEVTPGGAIVHQLSAHFDANHLPHHDVVATPANTILFIAQDPRINDGVYTVGDAIYEWSPETGGVTKRWSAFDFYDPAVDVGGRSSTGDWLHANSLALGDHGNVILSLNWISQVISISPDWHTIEWRMGGPHSTIALDSAAAFQGQHTAQVLTNGHLLVFDNGRDREGKARNSSAKEFANGHLVWTFTPSVTQYDPYVGSARRLVNGNTLVFFGMRDGFAGAVGPMAAYEVRPNGEVAWQLKYDGGNINYRATPLETIAGERSVSDGRFALPSP